MMWRLASTRAWVLLGSGDRFRVQLMNRALRSAPYSASGTLVGSVMVSPPWEWAYASPHVSC